MLEEIEVIMQEALPSKQAYRRRQVRIAAKRLSKSGRFCKMITTSSRGSSDKCKFCSWSVMVAAQFQLVLTIMIEKYL
jgi:hypothetical protein